MKIIFSYVLAFVLSLGVLVFPVFAPAQPSLSNADTWLEERIAWQKDGDYYCTYLGQWPQSYVGDEMNARLLSLVQSGALQRTGNTYGSGVEYDISAISPDLPRVARVTQTIALDDYDVCNFYGFDQLDVSGRTWFSTRKSTSECWYYDDEIKQIPAGKTGDVKFFYVEPVKWVILDGQDPANFTPTSSVKVISETALTAGIYPDYTQSPGDGGFIAGSGIMQQLSTRGVTPAALTLPSLSDLNYDYWQAIIRMTWASDYAIAMGALTDPNSIGPFCPVVLSDNYYITADGKFFQNNLYLHSYVGLSGDVHEMTNLEEGITQLKQTQVFAYRPVLTLQNFLRLKTFDEGIKNYPGIYKASDGSYHITDFTGLQAMSDYSYFIDNPNCFSAMTFYLDNDIDCAGKDFKAIKYFNGTLDGQGHAICNLTCINNGPDYQGGNSAFYGSVSCFIWGAGTGTTLSHINFLNKSIGDESDLSPAALIGGNVYNDGTASNISIVLRSVHMEGYTYGFANGFVFDATNSSLSITFCSIIEKFYEIYQFESTPNIVGSAAFAGVTTGSSITAMISYSIGGFYLLFPNNTTDANINSVYIATYDPQYPEEYVRQNYWIGTSNGFPVQGWTYYDNINNGLPYVWFAPELYWIPPNSNLTDSDIFARLVQKGFTQTTTQW